MAHLLEVETLLDREESPLNEYLLPGDVVRGHTFELIFSITNVGESAFPGGELSYVLKYENTKQAADRDQDHKISALDPGESTIVDAEVDATETGRVGVEVDVDTLGSERTKISSPDDEMDERQGWIYTLYCTDREQLLILDTLNNQGETPQKEEPTEDQSKE